MGERIIFSSLIITFYSHDDILLFIFKSTQSLSLLSLFVATAQEKSLFNTL